MGALNPEFSIRGLFIDGAWVPSEAAREPAEIRSPYDQSLVALAPRATAADVDRAVAAARAAMSGPSFTLAGRLGVLERAAELISQRRERFASAICLESAKPIRTARGEVDRALDTIRFTVAEARTMTGATLPIDAVPSGAGKLAYTTRTPVGVVAAIAPFNFPLNLVVHKVAPALAVGCAVVLKPASQTPVSSVLLAEVLEEAGLPAGWLNVVTGSGAEVGDALATHPGVEYVTFTGSPEVGWGIASAAPRKRVRLELGSNAPLIIDEGSDWEAAADAAAVGGFVQAGQSCVSTQRIFVHRRHAAEFAARLVENVRGLVVGDPRDEDVDVSAVINVGEATRIETWIRKASDAGARVLLGGGRRDAVVDPTVVADVTPDMEVQRNEIFGPVVTIVEFDDFGDALRQANDSRFGLNAGVFTRDLGHALRATRELQFGSVYINDVPTVRADLQPYGGVKDSGNTREGPRYAMLEMTDIKLVTMRSLSEPDRT